LGDYAQAQRHAEAALTVARALDDEANVATALRLVAEQLLARGNSPEARRHFEEAVAMLRRRPKSIQLSEALLALSEAHRLISDFSVAQALLEEALSIAREFENPRTVGVLLQNLAYVSMARGGGDAAPKMLAEALAIAQDVGSRALGSYALMAAACHAAFVGDWHRAARIYGAGVEQLKRLGLQMEVPDNAALQPLIDKTRVALGGAAFAIAEAEGVACTYEEAIAGARAWLESQ
jgi:tetratricopeptide (TPR) repeat protein